MRPSVYNLRSSATTLGHDDGYWAFFARLLEVGVRPSGPEVVWDLHRARRPKSPARELNGNSVSIPKLR